MLSLQYYIDPVSGYVFRSIKDVVCYLESGQIGRNAFKPKAKDNSIVDLEDDVFSVRMTKLHLFQFKSLLILLSILEKGILIRPIPCE